MSKLSIVGPKTMQKKVVEKLYNMKVYHVLDHIKDDQLDIGSPFKNADEIASTLVKLRAMLSYLEIDTSDFLTDIKNFRKKEKNFNYKEVGRIVEKLHKDFTKNVSIIKDLDSNVKRKETEVKKLSTLKKLNIDPILLAEYETLSYFIGYLNKTKGIEQELLSITTDFTFTKTFYDKKHLFGLFVVKEKREEIHKILEKRGLTLVDFSDIMNLSPSFLKGTVLEEKVKNIDSQKKSITKKLSLLKKNWAKQLVIYEEILTEESVKSEAPLKFASTEEAFFINGWVPDKKLEKVTDELNVLTNGRILMENKPIEKNDDVPVALKNPKPMDSFEFFLDLYALPKYKEIDPTFFLFLSFPLLFGFMLGDMGYGITTLVLFWLLKKKFPNAGGFFNILMFASVATIFFGALFGEVFGEEILFGYHLPNILSRAHEITKLLYVSIAIGIVHINIGLLIGFYNELIMHGFRQAVFGKLSWIVLQVGVAVGILYSPIYGAVIGGVSIIMIYLGEGVKGLVELPSIFSNMLSYARLMAIGVASVQLALVVNEFAKEAFHNGGFSILTGVAILVVGHVINMALGILGPFLHSLRLHYVEFFTKFFHGGGKRYFPFGFKE